MSGTRRKSVAGLDEMTPEEDALLKQMQAEDPGPEPEPVAEPEPPEEPAEEPVAAEKPGDKPADRKLVDKRALDEERSRRKIAQADLEKERRERAAESARLTERFNMLAQAVESSTKAPPPAEEPIPEFDKDPRANIDRRFGKLEKMIGDALSKTAAVETTATQVTQEQQNARALQDLTAWGNAQEQEYMAATPDYTQAVSFLRDARARHFEALGMDAAEIAANIRNDVINTAAFARQKGRNFGETLYKLAEASGYRKSAATTVQPTNGTARAPADNAAERLIRGQDMATTLGSTGAAARGETPASVIANMSEADFGALYAKIEKMPQAQKAQALRNLFGN